MSRTATAALLSLLTVTVTGCADTAPAADSAGGGGGKADDGTTMSGEMPKVDEERQAYMRAADAECLHVGYTDGEPYLQAVKLFCLPHGGTAAPIMLYVAVTPRGEADGAYEVFEVPTMASDVPEAVSFRMEGDRATITATIKHPDFESEEFRFIERTLTTTVTFTGEGWQPTVTGTYSLQ